MKRDTRIYSNCPKKFLHKLSIKLPYFGILDKIFIYEVGSIAKI